MKLEVEAEKSSESKLYKGKPFPGQYGKRGPRDSDSCTDILCIFVFLFYIGIMITLVINLRSSAHIEDLRELMDSEGNKCGVSKGFEEYKSLYFFKFSAPYKSTCVKECPKFDYNQIKFNSTGTAQRPITPLYFSNFSSFVKESSKFNFLKN